MRWDFAGCAAGVRGGGKGDDGGGRDTQTARRGECRDYWGKRVGGSHGLAKPQ